MDKLQALRDYMKEEGLAALLIPRTDEYQGEYLAPCSERLKWLTGFTGSSGFAVITLWKAAFFTDGRYILQARREVPLVYEQYDLAEKKPAQWVSEVLSSMDKIGYDPWLFTETQLQCFDRPLVSLQANPIDNLWEDRPLPPQGRVSLHPLRYTGEESVRKRQRICKTLKADYVLITACDSIAWLLNIRGSDVPHTPVAHSVCLLRKEGTYDLFVDLNKIADDVLSFLSEEGGRVFDISHFLSRLKEIQGCCQIDPQTTPVILLQILENHGVKVLREKDPCCLPKALKNEVELKGTREAHIQDGIALCRFLAWLEHQLLQRETTELSAAQKLYGFRAEDQHFKDVSFETISGFGPHGAIIHYKVSPESDIPIKPDGLYLLDSGGQYLTGTTDVTRTIAIGNPSLEQKDRYTRVLKGHIAIAQTIFPEGTTGAQLDALARQFLWQVGSDYAHGTGHGVGSYLSVHEGPQSISKRGANVPLKPGMILSNEPGYYKEGEYGIRIESLMHVIEIPHLKGFYGFETLTLVPLDLKLIETSLLTGDEKAWIRAYHEKVFEILSPHLDPQTKKWLSRKLEFILKI